MDKNIKFELTKNELETLIFLGASRVCDQKQLVGSEVGETLRRCSGHLHRSD